MQNVFTDCFSWTSQSHIHMLNKNEDQRATNLLLGGCWSDDFDRLTYITTLYYPRRARSHLRHCGYACCGGSAYCGGCSGGGCHVIPTDSVTRLNKCYREQLVYDRGITETSQKVESKAECVDVKWKIELYVNGLIIDWNGVCVLNYTEVWLYSNLIWLVK